nr:hypothetical protein [Tanacetum cinerariifolium]
MLNQLADAFSRMYDEDESMSASFMAIIQPLAAFLGELKEENRTLEELLDLHQQLDREDVAAAFGREGRLVIFHDRYFISANSKLKSLLLREFHNTPSTSHSEVEQMLVGLSALFIGRECATVWEYVSMDFITRIALSKGFTIVLVLVDRFSKYAHFAALLTTFNVHKVAEVFMHTVVKHHGIPKTIMSDHDPMFVSKFWTQLFKLSGKNQMEEKANLKRCEVEFSMGARVLLKLQPYRQLTLAKHLSNKLVMSNEVSKLPEDSEDGLLWTGGSLEEATWEWLSNFQAAYQAYDLGDKVVTEGEGNDMLGSKEQGRTKRV